MASEILSLADYIGQENIKKRLYFAIRSSILQQTSFPHTLMSGPPGLGKTTLARIIANETGCPFYSFTATQITEKTIQEILGKLPKEGYNLKTGAVEDRSQILPCVVFIDEIQNLSKRLTQMLHTVLENRTITVNRHNPEKGKVESVLCWVPEFTMIGATNYLGSLPKPFRDRFPMNILFEIYTDEEIERVISGRARKMGIAIEDEAVVKIASKSRGVPRIALSYFGKAHDVCVVRSSRRDDIIPEIISEDVDVMLESEEIDEMGLTRIDRKALMYLLSVNRPIGVKAFAQAIDEDVQTVENVIEPWLVKLKFIVRTGSGRYLTEAGRKYIGKERDLGLYPIQE